MKYYKAKELVEIMNSEGDEELSLRKVRYYTQIGVLSPLEDVNGKNKYTEKHLGELRALRTMQKTGEKLEDIGDKIKSLDSNKISDIAVRSSYYTSEHLFNTTSIQINEDVSISFSQKVKQNDIDEVVEFLKSKFK